MAFLSRLFMPHGRLTRLQEFVESIKPDRVMHGAESVRDETLRSASAISLSVLMATGRFYHSLTAKARKLAKASGQASPSHLLFDPIAFEAAAYCHYELMSDNLVHDDEWLQDDDDEWMDDDGEEDEDDDDDLTLDVDSYAAATRDAVHLTAGILSDHMSLKLPDEFFANRVTSYSLDPNHALAKFGRLLSCSIQEGAPYCGANDKLSLDLASTLAITTYIPIFRQTMIPGLRETCHRLHDHYAP